MTNVTRRQFLREGAVAMLAAGNVRSAFAGAPRQKPPYRLLYSNDLTNILSCTSPFHKPREPFRKEMLEATVDEVAGKGVDVHLLQPGLGVLPMWTSKVQPLEEHAAWLMETYGQKLDSYTQAVVNGTDLIQTFLDRCRMRGQAPFISIRMNDAHHKENVGKKKGEKFGSVSMSINRFYHAHPEYRLVPGSLSGKDLVLNWAEPEVRTQKLMLLQELCENYDLDGLELDFLRTYSYFRLAETTREQRAAIMTAFVKDVRALLDRTAREGRRRWLSLRVPCYLEAHDPLGIDLAAITAAGVDIVNASSHYFTTQQHHLAAIRKQVPHTTLYFELCHTIWKGEKVAVGYDVFPYRRATREHLHTAAHLACARGADGISLFNFAYYRENGTGEGRGVFGEPPFEALKALSDPSALAQGPQHWFIAQGWRAPGAKPLTVPRKILPGTPAKFSFDLAPPQGGWKRDARLRIQAAQPLGDEPWSAKFNGETLTSTPDVSEPFPVPYPSMMGKPEEMRAWLVP
ncbi:MAG TPA: hypothetical protein VD994_03670, partial [Prosthecobacter sp.]|nr:hypothetical protein [Prosthecobacter sp.]